MSESIVRRNNKQIDLTSKYLKPKKNEVAVHNKSSTPQNSEDAFKTSPLNNIKLDIDWVSSMKKKGKEDKKKFFLSRNESKLCKESKLGNLSNMKSKMENYNINDTDRKERLIDSERLVRGKGLEESGERRNDSQEVKKRFLDSMNSKEFNTISFLSNRIQKEFFMGIEIKRLAKKYKNQKAKDYERFGTYSYVNIYI